MILYYTEHEFETLAKELQETKDKLKSVEVERDEYRESKKEWVDGYWVLKYKIADKDKKLHALEKIAREGFNQIIDIYAEGSIEQRFAIRELRKIEELMERGE